MRSERYGLGIAKGMAVTFKNLFRKPVTTQYPEEKLVVSRRFRGNELAWSQEKCTGCHTCARSCPHDCIEIATPDEGAKGNVPAPCTQTCPSGVDAARYVRLIAEGKFAESLAVVRERIPFPCVCGYICAHPCETKCNRGTVDEPISIRVLKRFVWEHDDGAWKAKSKMLPPTGKRVAVVGGGPAGLSAAYYLTKQGHKVTIFEASPELGGMMRYGIPEYRLPKELLRAEIKIITDIGIEVKTNTSVNSLDDLTVQGFNAVFLGIGAQEGMGIGVEGENSPRVLVGVHFLRDILMGKKVEVGDKVAIIGGGNTAMDSARTALRLGAKEVTIIYRRTRAEMPASHEEVEEALAEGIKFMFLAAPSKVVTIGNEAHLSCIRMKLGARDASGRRQPEPIEGSEFTTPFSTVIGAIGQRPESLKPFGLTAGRGNTIQANADTMATEKPGVFAGGDAVSGPATVVAAIAAGRKAASAIDKELGGDGAIDEALAPVEPVPNRVGGPRDDWRVEPPTIPLKDRISTFKCVEVSLNDQMAVDEAKRCLRCDLAYKPGKYQLDSRFCIFCGLCVESCPFDALYLGYDYERSTYKNGELILTKESLLTPQKRKPSGYFHPEVEATLPKQSLLIDRNDRSRNNHKRNKSKQ